MALTSQLKKQVDLPVFEWLRFLPTATSATSAMCYGDNLSERYIYYLSGTTFYRYDTVSDSYQLLASPPTPALTAVTLRYTSYGGYRGNILGSTTNKATIAGLDNGIMSGYKIRITAGTGLGQERTITTSEDHVIFDHGVVTSAGANSIGDTTKRWTINQFIGYQVRLVFNTGQSQVRKVLYNDANTLYFYDINYQQLECWNNTPLSATAPYALPVTTAGSQAHYFIESANITVDTNWDTLPDATSSYVLMSGGVWMATSFASAPWMSFQYYDVLSDTWTQKTSMGGLLSAAIGTDFSIDRTGEFGGSYLSGASTSTGARTLTDTTKNMTVDRYTNYQLRITSGVGMGQKRRIVANSATSFEIEGPWNTIPSTTSTYEIYGQTDRIYFCGNAQAAMYKYNVETDNWFQGSSVDFGQTINMGIRYSGQEAFAMSTGVRNTGGILTINPTPVAGGSGYVVGEIITLGTGTNGKVRVTATNAGVVTALELFACGSGYTVATQSQTATSGAGTGCTCAVATIGTVGRITSVQNLNLAKGDSVTISGCTESAWNSVYTVLGIDSLTTFDIALTATATAVATATQSTTTIVDATKNWATNEHVGRLVQVTVAGTSPTTQVRRITANTATTLTLQSAITAAVNGTSRYVIQCPIAFGKDIQWKQTEKTNTGVPTGGSTTTLIDSTKNWFSNQWAGYKIRIVAGTGVGNEITITSNTSTTITYPTQTFTPDATTRYNILDTSGLATAGSTTTLTDSTKNWTVNMWAGKRLKITSGTGFTQELTIVSNTSNALTFATATAPSTDSTYTILGAPARGSGIELNWIHSNSDAETKGKYIIVPRGGGSNILDKYNIGTETYDYTIFISPQSETFSTGSMYCYDGKDSLFLTKDATGRLFELNLNTYRIDGAGQIPYTMGTATIGNRFEILKTEDNLYYLYTARHSGQEFYRTLVFW